MPEVIVIGAGPTGLACGIEAQRAGLDVLLIEKGCVVNSLFHYPANLIFFTTPELLEIGDIPFSTPNPKPNRQEALEYYRNVAASNKIKMRQDERFKRVGGSAGLVRVESTDSRSRKRTYEV